MLAILEKIAARARMVPCSNGGEDAPPGEPTQHLTYGKWRVESSIDGWINELHNAIKKAKSKTP
jgi:hypothetical protein